MEKIHIELDKAIFDLEFFINPLMSGVTFLYPLKTSEKRRFYDVFRVFKNVTLDINGLSCKTFGVVPKL